MAKKKRKPRAVFRKGHESRTRNKDFTHRAESAEDDPASERVSGKGQLTRRRTVAGGEIVADAAGEHLLLDIDKSACVHGVVLRVQGLVSTVRSDDGREFACATRQLLKQLATELRHVVAAGDRVWLRPEEQRNDSGQLEGIIERVEPRHGVLSRTSRGRQQLIAVNIDQALIVTSAAEPRIKPNLIDRYLITCERSDIEPILVINKIDLIDPVELVPFVGSYAQLGYQVFPLSTITGLGVERVRALLRGKQTVITGQSGVGKSSLLNAIDPTLQIRVQTVSDETQKGRHTTTTAELYPLEETTNDNMSGCGFVVDTPGIRSFTLWDVIAEEVAGYFRELRPFVSQCRYPDCSHTHEDFCAVKDAVADGWINARRYESYLKIHAGDEIY